MTAIRENGATSGAGVLATYGYDNLGRRTSVTRGNGTTTNYGFDTASRLNSLDHDITGSVDDLTLTFTHAPSGQITSKVRSSESYDFDEFANLSEQFEHNGLNQSLSNMAGAITYDGRGNLITSSGQTFSYDIWDNLTGVTGNSKNATLVYDPVGRLSSVTDNGASTTTQFLYSGAQAIAEYDGSGTLLRRYVHGVGTDEPIAWYEGSGTSDRRFLMADHQGSIIGVTNSSGAIIDKNSYSIYGVPDSENIGRFQYTGQMWIAEAGVYHYKARAYDPNLRRFLQADPIGYAAGMNIYAYVGGDPMNFTDPSGLEEEQCVTTPTNVCARGTRTTGYVGGADLPDFGPSFTIPVPGGFGWCNDVGCGVQVFRKKKPRLSLRARAVTSACNSLKNRISEAQSGLLAMESLLGLAGVSSGGTFFSGIVSADFVVGIGGGSDYGVYSNADMSDFGFFITSTTRASGFDIDIGSSVFYTESPSIAGASQIVDLGVGRADLYSATGNAANGGNSTFGTGYSYTLLDLSKIWKGFKVGANQGDSYTNVFSCRRIIG